MSELIVNADDFGLHNAVNEGIMEGHTKGIVTSTSLLAGGGAFKEAVVMAKSNPKLGIGVHIALVGGIAPVSDPLEIPTLVTEKGVFLNNYTEFMKRVYTGKINYDEVRKEICRQIEKIIDTGLTVTHIDGHQHMHVLPTVLPIIMEQALAHNIKAIRIPSEKALFINYNFNFFRMLGKIGLSRVAYNAYAPTRRMGLKSTAYFWGMINGGNLTERNLFGILKQVKSLPGTHEIMTHPGNNNAVLEEKYNWNYSWEQELRALCSDHIRRYLGQYDIRLINYGDLQ